MTLFKNRISIKLLLIVHLVAALMLAPEAGYGAKKKNKDITYAMTEAELQAQVMAFADRYSAVISSANRKYLARSPSPENRRTVRSQLVYSVADAFTIAAGLNPDAAFLDMVVMVTLGRMVFEEHYAKKYGRQVDPGHAGSRYAKGGEGTGSHSQSACGPAG
jgi:hypothetical protein